MLATNTRPIETVYNVDDGGNIVRSATINHNRLEDSAGTDGGSVSLRNSLQTRELLIYGFHWNNMTNKQWYDQFKTRVDVETSIEVTTQYSVLLECNA